MRVRSREEQTDPPLLPERCPWGAAGPREYPQGCTPHPTPVSGQRGLPPCSESENRPRGLQAACGLVVLGWDMGG